VVIDNLNIESAFDCPSKAHAPLVIDADAVLAFSVTFERFKPIARRCSQIVQHG
jgi:hypothetical protein